MVSRKDQEAEVNAPEDAGAPRDGETVTAIAVPTIALRDLKTFDDVVNAYGDRLIEAKDILGDGFQMLKEKNKLVGMALVILDHHFGKSTFAGKDEFSVVRLMTKYNEKYIIVDGGEGIHKQMQEVAMIYGEDYIRDHGIVCPDGLSRSDYTFTDEETGEVQPATTYYFTS